MATRSLVVSADDYGLTRTITDTILKTVDNGVTTNVSILANGEAVTYALNEYKKRAEHLQLFVHLNLTEGPALSPKETIPLLVDSGGYFKHSIISLWVAYLYSGKMRRTQLRDQVAREISAQICAIHEPFGQKKIDIIRVNGHQHVHMIPFIFNELMKRSDIRNIRLPAEPLYFVKSGWKRYFSVNTFARFVLSKLAHRYRTIASMHHIQTNDYFLGILFSGCVTYATVEAGIKRIQQLPPCTFEILLHPGGAVPNELMSWREHKSDLGWHYSKRRLEENNLLCDPRFVALVSGACSRTGVL